MDFCKLLHKAQKNEQSSGGGARFYSTKFEPPKRIKKEKKNLSDNIKKFLAKKEAEEQKKQQDAQRKKEDLLALRAQDKKATRRVNVMLKRTKSANQSVIDDAADQTHTAVTSSGTEQPDEDDYGYVSQEASALYEKMMEKYSQMPEEPKFNLFKKKVSTNLSSTKDRVKAALDKEREEAMMPHRRKRKKKNEDGGGEDKVDEDDGGSPERKKSFADGGDASLSSSSKEKEKVKPKPRPAGPPPVSFTELLKIAAQKQHEPILLEEKVVEEERLYTKKQRKEMERERDYRERKEQREREQLKNPNKLMIKPPCTSNGGGDTILERQLTKKVSFDGVGKDNKNKPASDMKQPKVAVVQAQTSLKKPLQESRPSKPSTISQKSEDSRPSKADNRPRTNGFDGGKVIANGSNRPSLASSKAGGDQRVLKVVPSSGASKEMARRDLLQKKPSQLTSGKPKEFPPRDLVPKVKPKEFPPRDLKPKQFRPENVERFNSKKKPIVANRGRIMDDDDDEDEYDSELDDFIDDGDADVDVSSCIKEIFGYDKSRFRDLDDDVDNMESSFAQQMREEVVSAKIGIMEDLEDMKKEEEEKRRKALMKKKMRR